MTWFLAVGGIGVVIVVLSLVFTDLFEGVFEAIDIDVGAGLFSTPVIGSFLAAFGLTGALVLQATAVSAVVAALAGVGAGVALGGAALAVTRSLMHMRTDEPVRLIDLVGKTAVVVSPIPSSGFGEVTIVHAGQRMKLNARNTSEVAVPVGGRVVVVAVNSASSVLVEAESDFWGQPASLE